MQSVDPTLFAYAEAEIIPRYLGFDKAHHPDHVRTVIRESLRLASRCPDADPDLVYAVAAYHDTGLVAGRERHHLVSGQIVSADATLRRWFDKRQIDLIREAVEDHRASSDHEPRSIYGKIVAEADRIIDPQTTLRRTVQYGLEHFPELDAEEQYARFRRHLQAKYAEGGYLKLWIPFSSNAVRLQELRLLLADEPRLRATFAALCLEEHRNGE